ncbi:Scr1 family TA system antitoxin-like transcriptional regulator [Streptomyces sp. BE20]|uniref:Scr1 family TA system antitoxin-like transcriptional regulator n=1 Tax=Streptomyces sp. BE20 TaxID=3002525 RepID=UPI002E788A67|nr:Scr1 family TA system antitoxin-like transcriptional regulator [Streptomyces sp. BE20]MEE1820992.1 Scr1 family TA system antitoxin-like transcriptional regulator [Streptomyces sp. BE20]
MNTAARLAALWVPGLDTTALTLPHARQTADRLALPDGDPDRQALLALAELHHRADGPSCERVVDTRAGRQDRLEALAARAVRVRSAGTLVPGGLRTPDYARLLGATAAGSRYEPTTAEPVGAESVVVLDESALHQSHGRPHVVADQFGHLIRAARAGTVAVSLAPTTNPHRTACVTHLRFADRGPDLTVVEQPDRVVYLLTGTPSERRARAVLGRWLRQATDRTGVLERLAGARAALRALDRAPPG